MSLIYVLFLSVMTQEDFRRLKRGKLLILLIKKKHPVYVSNKYILGPMNKHFDGVDPNELVHLLIRLCTVC